MTPGLAHNVFWRDRINAIAGLTVGIAGSTLLGTAPPVLAHGVVVEHSITQTIRIQASYDTGEPMAEAQVNVYAPDAPQEVWTTGTTDSDGVFTFTPDAERLGNWEVQVRQAGHGDITVIPLQAEDLAGQVEQTEQTGQSEQTGQIAAGESSSYSPAQMVVMGAAGVWGFVGTALFFWRRSA